MYNAVKLLIKGFVMRIIILAFCFGLASVAHAGSWKSSQNLDIKFVDDPSLHRVQHHKTATDCFLFLSEKRRVQSATIIVGGARLKGTLTLRDGRCWAASGG